MDKEKSRCNTVDAKDEYDKWPYKTPPNKTRRWNKIQRTTAVTSELSTVSSTTIVYMASLVAMAYVGLVLYCRHGRIHRLKNWIIHQLCCNLKDAVGFTMCHQRMAYLESNSSTEIKMRMINFAVTATSASANSKAANTHHQQHQHHPRYASFTTASVHQKSASIATPPPSVSGSATTSAAAAAAMVVNSLDFGSDTDDNIHHSSSSTAIDAPPNDLFSAPIVVNRSV